MAGINYSKSVSCVEKEYVYYILYDEEVEELHEAMKEQMELMMDESKPKLDNIW